MKSGAVSKTDCYYTGDKSVCGVAGNSLTQPKSQPQPKAPAQPKAPPQAQAPAQPKAQPQTQPNGNSVLVRFVNKMSQTIWVGLQGRSKANANWKLPFDGGFELPAGKMVEARFPLDLNAARFWGRTGCKNVNGLFKCETGNCDYLHCANGGVQRGGATPATLAEFTLNGHGDKDYYDISLVDGYNLPMSITPLNPSQGNAYWCKVAGCTSDLNRSCPSDLQKKNSNGQVVGCLSACERFKTDAYCCRGAHNLPSTCNPAKWPFNYASVFKKSCPAAYSYAYDDATSTFFCRNTGYTIQFG